MLCVGIALGVAGVLIVFEHPIEFIREMRKKSIHKEREQQERQRQHANVVQLRAHKHRRKAS